MYTICDPENHPFDLGQTIWFKGGRAAIANPTFCGFKVGDAVTVTALLEDEDGEYVRIAEDAEKDDEDNAPVWNVNWFTDCQSKVIRSTPTNVQEDDMNDTTSTRPTIDFSGTSRATARGYAVDLQSRVNKAGTNAVLKTIAEGGEVDAFDAAEALLDAMRHVATRFGQSMQRRREGEKVAHLGYIVHGVLANAADNLPAYQTGERSRVVAEAKVALTEAREEVEALTTAYEARKVEADTLREERGLLTQAASDERRRLCAEIDGMKRQAVVLAEQRDDIKALANNEIDRLQSELSEARRVIEGLTDDVTRLVALREYVEGNLLDSESLAACAGFTHGWVSATRD